jgi:plasmid stability protein
MHSIYRQCMGVTVQVRNLDAGVQEQLRKAAATKGLSLSAFLRDKLTELAHDLEVRERADRLNAGTLRNKLGGPFPELDKIPIQEIVRMTREDRDGR